MKLSPTGADLIKSFEGCKLKAYRCPAGVWTIGYGHTGDDVYEGQVITKKEADVLFRMDIAFFEKCVSETCPDSTQSQFDAMVSLAYNIGPAAFKKSSVAKLHNKGKYPEAQQAFSLWNKAGGKVVNGLVTRRAREADRYDDDDLPTDVEGMPHAVEGEKPLSQSRTINGQALAGTGGAGLMALNEYQSTIQELIPYFDQLKWVLLALIVGGVLLTIWGKVAPRLEGRA